MANRPSPIHAMVITGEGEGRKRDRELHRKGAFSLGGEREITLHTRNWF